jgi:hypothetical protein
MACGHSCEIFRHGLGIFKWATLLAPRLRHWDQGLKLGSDMPHHTDPTKFEAHIVRLWHVAIPAKYNVQDLMQPESVSRTNVLTGSGNRLLLWYGPCKWSTILTLINSEIQLLIKYETKLLEIQRSLIRRASHAIPSTDNLQYSEGRAYLRTFQVP